ncbi:hypothetical protein AAZX31_06G215200 [Glycine max]
MKCIQEQIVGKSKSWEEHHFNHTKPVNIDPKVDLPMSQIVKHWKALLVELQE